MTEAIPAESDDVIYYPVKAGDWIASKGNPQMVAKVRSVYHDFYKSKPGSPIILVDLYLYSINGVRTGRESPAMGGPRTFEPACEYEGWERIEEPRWPIRIRSVPIPGKPGSCMIIYHHGAKVLPDRKWAKKARLYTAPVASKPSDYDPQLEAHSRRMAAQELRDIARGARGEVVEMLRKRAVELERQADAIKPRT